MMAGFSPAAGRAAVVNFTGNVVSDFESADPTHQSTWIVPVNSSPQSLGQWASQTGNGTWVSGWNIRNIYLNYDKTTGTLAVGFANWANAQGQMAPFGNAMGNPAGTSAVWDPPRLGYGNSASDKAVALVFAQSNPANPNIPGAPVFIAGVPADHTKPGPGLDGFTVATIDTSRANAGLGYLFGKNLAQNQGALAFDPSTAHPGLEFTIANFNKLIEPSKGIWLEGFAGSDQDRYVGQSHLAWTHLPVNGAQTIPPDTPPTVPEPASLLAWTFALGAVAYRAIRRSRASA
jgi:hypothetical protein